MLVKIKGDLQSLSSYYPSFMNKYDNYSKEELLALVEKQENELASKKYGLVWDSEREPESVVLDCEYNVPVLKRVKGKEIKTSSDQEDNILIEGDNYHALTVLNYTHQEKIDVIYIDPPYNTGKAKEWKYNDKYIDEEDSFKHSKWLNMMEKRLIASKSLLKESGSIFISIDYHEVSQLKLLLDKIFGENNFVSEISWQGLDTVKNDAKYFSNNHEYIFCYAKNKENLIIRGIKRTQKHNAVYKNPDNDPKGPYLLTPLHAKSGSENSLYEFKFKNGIKWKPPEGTFPRFSRETLSELEFKNQIYFSNKLNSIPQKKTYLSEVPDFVKLTTFWNYEFAGSTRQSNKELSDIIGKGKFENPKPVSLMKILIGAVTEKDNLILDFFAGSGTTGQAVLELNKEDKGDRRFILCTNNENKICEDVTYPRIQKVIKGYKKNGNNGKVLGLNGNLQYFKTELIKKTDNKDQARFDLTQKCTEMLCVKENIFNLEAEKEDYKIFSSNKKDRFLCVYYNLYDESFNGFLKEVKKIKGKKQIYVFSIDGKIDRSLFHGINDFEVEEIPQKIIDIYRQLMKMNIPVKADTIFLDFEKAKKKVFEEKDKDDGARVLRIVLEKTIQKIAQKNKIVIFKDNNKEEKIAILNDNLYNSKVLKKVQWEENKTYLAIGNHASHGEYDEYGLSKVEDFYKHIQSLFNDFGI